jgi:hypothetical protein
MPSQIFNSSSTWTVPDGIEEVRVQCWGGGGAGGHPTFLPGGGGGGGAYAESTIAVVPGTIETIEVGAGGAGSNGGQTYFRDATTVMAQGGGRPSGGQTGSGSGGLASRSVGDIVFSGGAGNIGLTGGGGGGGSATSLANGNAGSGTSGGAGEGNGGNGGTDGSAPGGGGGGWNQSFTGLGAAGRMVLTWVVTDYDIVEFDVNIVQNLSYEVYVG